MNSAAIEINDKLTVKYEKIDPYGNNHNSEPFRLHIGRNVTELTRDDAEELQNALQTLLEVTK